MINANLFQQISEDPLLIWQWCEILFPSWTMMWISETDGNLRSGRDECVISLRVRARRAPTNAAWSRPPIFGRKNPIGNPFILRAGRQSTHPAASIWLNSHFSTFSSGSRISAKIGVTSQKQARAGLAKRNFSWLLPAAPDRRNTGWCKFIDFNWQNNPPWLQLCGGNITISHN